MNAKTPATNSFPIKTRLPVRSLLASIVSSAARCATCSGSPNQGIGRRWLGQWRPCLSVGLALALFGVLPVSRGVAGESLTIAGDPNNGARSELDPVRVEPQWVVITPSPRVLGVVRRSDGVALVRTLGWPGTKYQLEVSDDLVEWRSVGEARSGNGRLLEIQDPEAVGKPQRFYRFEVSTRTAPLQ